MNKIKALALALLATVILAGPVQATSNDASAKAAININTASVEQLTELPHVGVKRAEMIVERRQDKPFTSVEELLEIKGIGPKTLEKIRPHVALDASSE